MVGMSPSTCRGRAPTAIGRMDEFRVGPTPAPDDVSSASGSDDRPIPRLVVVGDPARMKSRQLTRAPEPPGPVVPWTYELPPEGGSSEGLEGYAVESSEGEWVGSVRVVLRRGSDQYLAVKRSALVGGDVRLVPWADVAAIDHATETVRLARSAAELAAAPRLVRGNGTHRHDAEAVRITGRLVAGATGAAGRIEPRRSRFGRALALSALVFLTILMTVVFASAPHPEGREHALFALPALVVLGALGAALALRDRMRRRG